MSDPLLVLPAASVPLEWTASETSWQGTSANGEYSYTIETMDGGLFHVDQLDTTHHTVVEAQQTAQDDYDRHRRIQAWGDFFATHEPPP